MKKAGVSVYLPTRDTMQVAELDASCHRKEASDGAHVAKDRDDEGVGQVGGGLAATYRRGPDLGADYQFR